MLIGVHTSFFVPASGPAISGLSVNRATDTVRHKCLHRRFIIDGKRVDV